MLLRWDFAMNKRGRPTDSKKNISIKIRVDLDTYKKLEFCASVLHLSKSEIIRQAILQMHNTVEQYK